MGITIYFDLDGTLYDLYNIENWEQKLREEKPNMYNQDRPLYTPRIHTIVSALLRLGVKFHSITKLSMTATKNYAELTTEEKRSWVRNNLPFISNISVIPYADHKSNYIRRKDEENILIDDSEYECSDWTGTAYKANGNVEEILTKILESFNKGQ